MSNTANNTNAAGISGWGDPSNPVGDADAWAGWMGNHSKEFDTGVNNLKAKLEDAFDTLKGDPGNPVYLGAYQSALSEYNMYRMLQSNSTKSLTDQSKSVIRNLA